MSIVNRLKQYMDHVGMPSTQFADEAKVARPTISQILNGRNRKISNELLEKLHEAFPTLNILWLLFGDGDMEVKANTQTSKPQNSPNLFDSPIQNPTPQSFSEVQQPNSGHRTPLRNSNIEEFVAENTRTAPSETESTAGPTQIQQMAAAMGSDQQKRIQTIMVFYNDNSFEIFTPTIKR